MPFTSYNMSSFHKIITFDDDKIHTTVTACAISVDVWINQVLNSYRHKLGRLVVGLDTEWCRPTERGGNQKVAILQLCVGRKCLIFKLIHADYIPTSLVDFLGNKTFTFVGKEVRNDAAKLFAEYELYVANTKDLAEWAASKSPPNRDREIRRMGLKTLAREYLDKELEKPKQITLSRWNAERLSFGQIKYACLDAVVSFQLGLYFLRMV